MKYFTVFFCYLLINSAIAQVQTVDSLLVELSRHQKEDTLQVNILNMLSYQYQWLDFNKSLEYAEEALRLAEPIEFQSGIATACFRQAHCYWALGDSERAIEKALRAVNIAEKEHLTDILAETYRILAISYRDQQELAKAVSYIRQAELLSTQQKNWDLLARVYNLAGVIDYTRDLKDSALAYYTKALLVTDEHATSKFHVSQVLSNIGEIYLEDDPDKGLEYFTKALSSAKETRNKSAEAGIIADIGRAHIQKRNYVEADHYLKESLQISRKLGLKRVSRHVYYALVDLRLREGKTTEAFNYMRSYYDVRDSLLNGSKTRQIVELETRFEKEKQDQRIQLLEQEKTIQRIWTNVLIVGALLLIITIVIIYRLQKLRAVKDRQLLQTQQSLNEKLKETDSLKSRFFANISHEFRTPLSLILGPVEEQLRNSQLPTAQKKTFHMIQRNAQRLLSLVNQLLDLSKLEAGKMELFIQQGNLGEFLQLLTASFDSLAEHKQITFTKNILPLEKSVGYDADKVEKIVNNILFNAFKFTPIDGEVIFTFQIHPDKNEMTISVMDTGKGIPKEELANVFSPFYQLKNDGEEGQPGTGLGLSLVNELVKLYGGNISLKSELNEGTCIEVTLPLLHANTATELHLHREIPESGAQPMYSSDEEPESFLEINAEEKASILIVEDNSDLRNFIASGFRNEFTILLASNGEEGISEALKHIPDLIISDVMMPKLNGLDFSTNIKTDERTCHIPVILLTAKADASSRIEGLKTGADDYLAKPFSMEELQVRVQNLLSLRKKLAENLKKELASQHQAPEPKELSLDQKFILKVKSAIESNISNSHFSVEILAEEMNLSRAQLFRKVKALINTSPSELINDLRLQRAAHLIRAKADNVAQIGYAVGFNEQSYFSKRFRKKFGVSPSEYSN
ncbi:MAG TPA: ATP-binding protein [Chryseolinea sp.]|nr:ATP-binding protein [Chryseolinea sp.]